MHYVQSRRTRTRAKSGDNCVTGFLQMGIQEKSTFVSSKFSSKALRLPIMTLPATIVVLLAVLGGLVLAHQAPAQSQAGLKPLESGELLEAEQLSPSAGL